MLRVALTGGIASGKSTAADHFATLGVPVIDADLVARELVQPGEPLLEALARRFGPDILAADGGLDRRALRRRVFANPAERRDLEALMHPAIHARMRELAAQAEGPYLLLVIPLLVESDRDWGEDRVLLIDAPESLQRQRLMARDHCTAAEADAILAAQASREARLARADDVIANTGDPEALRQAVERIHRRYLALAAAGSSAPDRGHT